MISNSFKKNKPITKHWVINAAINTAFPFICLKKKAKRKIPNTFP